MAGGLRVAALGVVALALVAGKKTEKPQLPAVGPTVVPSDSLYLRSSFDLDPSRYVGRFIPTGATDIDESSAVQTTCGKYVQSREIDAGGVTYDEIFSASSSVAGRIGVPLVVGVSASTGQSRTVRVRYTLHKKLVYEITDPPAFEACCKAAPDQCTDRFVGEFLLGSGEVFHGLGSDTAVKGQGASNAVVGAIEVKDGVAWARSIQFPTPVYFAFKVANNAWSGAQSTGCGPWTDAPPKSTLGTYFVGVAEPRATEAEARTRALGDARVQAVRWAGTQLSETTVTDRLGEVSVLTSASSGVAQWIKDESWCTTPMPTPEGTLYVAKVLAFLPKADEQAVADAVARAAR